MVAIMSCDSRLIDGIKFLEGQLTRGRARTFDIPSRTWWGFSLVWAEYC